MLTRENFKKYAGNFLDFCEYPAVRYKIKLDFLDMSYESLKDERAEFLKSDIVLELRGSQDYNGMWGKLYSWDYKDKTTRFNLMTSQAVKRAVYIGLRIDDDRSDILTLALEHLEEILSDKTYGLIRKYGIMSKSSSEHAIPNQLAGVAALAELISPDNYNKLCDDLFNKWLFVAECAFEGGKYSPESELQAQREIFGISRNFKGDTIGFRPLELLLGKGRNLSPELESAFLSQYAENAYHNGYFWRKPLNVFQENIKDSPEFINRETRRYFVAADYINQFRNNKKYLENFVGWLEFNKNQDNLWDCGSQVGFDPWGDQRYFSLNKKYKYNRIIDITVDVLSIFKKYLDNNAN